MRADPAGLEGEVCSQHSHELALYWSLMYTETSPRMMASCHQPDVSVTSPEVDEQDSQAPTPAPQSPAVPCLSDPAPCVRGNPCRGLLVHCFEST